MRPSFFEQAESQISHLQPGIQKNADLFFDLSTHLWATGDGVAIELCPKPVYNYEHPGSFKKKPCPVGITSLIGDIGERVAQRLLPDSSLTWKHSPYDIQMPSACTSDTVFVEVKTAQTDNRGVIRIKQIRKYQDAADNAAIYYTQVFYRMRDGRIPSKFRPEELEENLLPICIYIFPVSFIIYLVNTIHPTGQNEATQFYGLTPRRAQSLFDMFHDRRLFGMGDGAIEKYDARVFTATHLLQNPEAKLHIIDHVETPHILWRLNDPFVISEWDKYKYLPLARSWKTSKNAPINSL